ncbi:AcrR family transcriptional regulator [Mesorhizobium soli]|jgi:AcrR family transcriptional regulator|uniref:TetR/AcrR family transcriptional regulator n=1 Tax=Pseudaminobacter soli (ex Li et al. 2025) TaxID=1295366 RepID=UPI002475DBEC|nr:TetR/AcrR family transcriptional regulator [Mesorhizobium soli]MDH6231402.1 AcrR family transcriptional regulator [Mesorhizobium soli]
MTQPTTAQSRRERHKAELRAELLRAAHELIKEEGYEGLTIRNLAKRVGYAPMSVYSYFADKHAILLALAEDAFATLAWRMEQDVPAEPLAALRKIMDEYAIFALENPNEYRTVFMTFMTRDPAEFCERSVTGIEELEGRNPALRVLLKRVQACIDAGIFKGDAHAISTLLWSCSHGAISLQITRPFYPFGEPGKFLKTAMEVTLAGLRAQQQVEALVAPEERR